MAALYFKSIKGIVSGKINNSIPVTLFITLWTATNCFWTTYPDIMLVTLMSAMIPIQTYSPMGMSKTGINLNRQKMTKMKSAIVSNLAPNALAVSVRLATQPSATSVSPAVRYSA